MASPDGTMYRCSTSAGSGGAAGKLRLTAVWVLLLIRMGAWGQSVVESGSKANPPEPNRVVLQVLRTVSDGGGYSVSSSAFSALRGAVRSQGGSNGEWVADAAKPSFCSGATYVVFLRALQRLVPDQVRGEPMLRALMVRGQPDGTGVWGRWNANGPGTAVLFLEAGLGMNFEQLEKAEPGDFLKIFWNDGVGANERGHSVVYLGRRGTGEAEEIQFWSSNQPSGYGSKWVPLSRVRRLLFSRLERPENIRRILEIPVADSYLGRLSAGHSDWAELERRIWGKGGGGAGGAARSKGREEGTKGLTSGSQRRAEKSRSKKKAAKEPGTGSRGF